MGNPAGRGSAVRDPLRVAALITKLAMEIARGIADYRLMPDTVDYQRARRRRHDRAVAALTAARAAGLPGPGNPWTADMLITAGATAAMGGLAANGVAAARAQSRFWKSSSSASS